MPFSAAARASSDVFTGRAAVDTPMNVNLVAERFAINLTTADLANGTVGGVAVLPAGCIPLGLEIDATDMDSNGTPTLAYSVGILNAAETAISTAAADGGAAWLTGRNEGRAEGVSGYLTSLPMRRVQPVQADRTVGIQVTGAAATAVAGTLGITLYYRQA